MTEYRSGIQDTVFDVAQSRYGGLEGLARLLADNPDMVQNDGSLAQFGATYLVGKANAAPTELEVAATTKQAEARILQRPEYRSNGQQTVFDVALMQYGNLGGLSVLLTDNAALVKDDGTVRQFGQVHRIQTKVATNLLIKKKMLRLVPATEGNKQSGLPWLTRTLGPWRLQNDLEWLTKTG